MVLERVFPNGQVEPSDGAVNRLSYDVRQTMKLKYVSSSNNIPLVRSTNRAVPSLTRRTALFAIPFVQVRRGLDYREFR